jgi:hypothetical protein
LRRTRELEFGATERVVAPDAAQARAREGRPGRVGLLDVEADERHTRKQRHDEPGQPEVVGVCEQRARCEEEVGVSQRTLERLRHLVADRRWIVAIVGEVQPDGRRADRGAGSGVLGPARDRGLAGGAEACAAVGVVGGDSRAGNLGQHRLSTRAPRRAAAERARADREDRVVEMGREHDDPPPHRGLEFWVSDRHEAHRG